MVTITHLQIQNVGAVLKHTHALIESLQALTDAQSSGLPVVVTNNLATRALESIE